MPAFTFLDNHNLAGKTIAPFFTHEGSGLRRSEADIRTICPKSRLVGGLAIHGTHVNGAGPAIKDQLKTIG